MDKRLKMIKIYLLRGYSLEKIGEKLGLEEVNLLCTMQRNSSYFKDLTWVLKRKIDF